MKLTEKMIERMLTPDTFSEFCEQWYSQEVLKSRIELSNWLKGLK